MLCDSCKKNEANIFFKALVNNETTKMNLCETCARDKGIFSGEWGSGPFANAAFGLPETITGWPLHGAQELAKAFITSSKPAQTKCSNCATTYNAFKDSGFAGCAGCYEAFYPAMQAIIKKIHGSNIHTGRIYGKKQPGTEKITVLNENLALLKKELDVALKQEAYEKAAVLRDKIHEMERQGSR